MVVRVQIIRCAVVLWLIYLSHVASYIKLVALSGCQEYCGSVAISYPFGISKNCYFNKWFEIDCNKNNIPYIKSIGLSVATISESTLQVFVPVNFSIKGGGISSYDLRGTPFSFLRMRNSLVGIGCNIIAYTTDHDYDSSVWCSNICHSDDFFDSYGGCEAELQENIYTLEPIILSAVRNKLIISNSTRLDRKDVSGFGFLADQDWLSKRQNKKDNSTGSFYFKRHFDRNGIKDIVENVPVNLHWELYNATSASIGAYNVTTSCETKERWFQSNNSFYSNGSTFKCSCRANYEGNPYLPDGCYPGLLSEAKRMFWGPVVIGLISSGVLVLLVLVPMVWCLKKVVKKQLNRRKKRKYFKQNGGLLLQRISVIDGNIEKTKVFSLYELEKATDRFNVDRVLGQGGQGTVYKGMLSNGRIVAVKKSKFVDLANVGQFINEVVILSQINHRNVVKLLGCCLEAEVPLLVYEFILNGTLFQHIHNPNDDFPLTWEKRLRIGAEVAGAISYMHSAASLPIYHRDIKSTNILLDFKYKAKVSDFGISRSVDIDKTHFTTLVQGTFGYLDPEYFRSSQFTEKSDVYSFGVVLVELLTGRKPIFSNTSQEVKGLAPHFIELMDQNQFLDMIDPQISEEGKMEEIMVVAHLAKMCLNLDGKRRPTMKEVLLQLEGIRMSRGKTTTLDNNEGIENIETTNIIEGYDTSSTSTGTWCKGTTASSLDELPFLTYP